MRQVVNNYQFAQRKLTHKLTCYYKFNETVAFAKDYAPNPVNIGAVMGSPIYENGKLGLCCTFNTNQTGYRSPNGHRKLNMDSGDGFTPLPFSISFWMKISSNDIPTYGMIFGLIGRTGTAKDQWYVQYRTTVSNVSYNMLSFVKVDGGINKSRRIDLPENSLPIGEWIFVVITDDGIGTENIFINGSLVSSNILDNGYVSFLTSTPYGSCISALSAANYTGQFFPGSLDDIAIFKDYILSKDDIDWLYNSGNGNEII